VWLVWQQQNPAVARYIPRECPRGGGYFGVVIAHPPEPTMEAQMSARMEIVFTLSDYWQVV